MTRASVLRPALGAALACVFQLGCGQPAAPPPPGGSAAPAGAAARVALVNGVAVTEAEVELAARGSGHGAAPAPADKRREVLETIIRDELAAQRATMLGLDAEATFRAELARMEAQVAAFKRKRLAELFYRNVIAKEAKATEAEAKAFYDENAARIRTEIHVFQILKRDEAAIAAAHAEIAAGAPFEEVARKAFPGLPPEAGTPWDLGWLSWKIVPEPWRAAVDGLPVGGTSGVIGGPSSRYWIVKIVDRRENPAMTFEAAKSTIIEVLEARKLEKARAETESELRAAAKIVYEAPPAGTPAPETEP